MIRVLALGIMLGLAQQAQAFDTFTVEDIRIDGLSRISPGTVLSYLPVEKGDSVTGYTVTETIRALYKTGFFKDVQVSHQGDILVITLEERPAISKIEITGNKEIKDEDLLKGLREIGLSEGETFDRLQLDRLAQELTRQYNNRGKYNVSIKPKITELDRNRVEVLITIVEGKAAKIKHINIVGNQVFAEEKIREDFESSESNWLSWYRKDDQYSREKLSGDLEKLTAYYQDRGYVDFNVESTQVSISPDKKDMYLTANVREGETYIVSEIKLAGDLIVDEKILQRLILQKAGETYSQKKLDVSAQSMQRVLTNMGYAFAEVNPVPELDREKREVAVTFAVSPGKKTYVRRIRFEGNMRTQDEVMRREMRQFEGAWFSQAAVDRSKTRLQRLGFFKTVEVETPQVPGTDDQIDVIYTVEETSAGAFQFGIGYSALLGLSPSVSVTQRNFMGTGNSAGLTLQSSSYYKRFNFNYMDPYFTDDGLSLGYNLNYSSIDNGEANIAQYSSEIAGGSILTAIPITETDSISMSLGLESNKIETYEGYTPQSIIDYLNDVGHKTFHTWRFQLGWARDSRNKYFAPTRGMFQSLGAEVALPGSTQEYYKINYQISRYWPVARWFTLLTRADFGYGDGYGETNAMPFFENYYAGGASGRGSVRGFEDNTLGPCQPSQISTYCQPLGGAFLTIGSLEAIFPTPFAKKSNDTMQISAFLDVGNVYQSFNTFEARDLRASTGLSLKWQAPVGPIVINLAYPLISEDGDRTESLQFSFGGSN